MTVRNGSPRAGWYLAAAMAMVGANVALGKFIVAQVPVFAFLLLRALLACGLFVPEYVAHWRGTRRLRSDEKRNLFLQAFLGIFMFSTCMLFGLRNTSAAAAGVITSTIPAAVALLSFLILRERLTRPLVISIGLACIGVACLNLARTGPSAATSSTWFGNGLILAAVMFEASYVILSKRLTSSLSPLRISAFANLYAAMVVLPFGLWELGDVQWAALSLQLWLVMIWYVLAASVFSFWLWMKGIARLPASRAGVFTAVLPVATAVTAVAFLGESLGLVHLAAFACIAFSVWISARTTST